MAPEGLEILLSPREKLGSPTTELLELGCFRAETWPRREVMLTQDPMLSGSLVPAGSHLGPVCAACAVLQRPWGAAAHSPTK